MCNTSTWKAEMGHSVFQGQGQQGSSASDVLATKPDDWRFSPRYHTVEGENHHDVVLWPPHARHSAMYILPY